ncbi:MAG: glycogen debranching enzyme [Microbacterium sp.]|nr:glycogen debranching enzyme [Microbacterium sp.]
MSLPLPQFNVQEIPFSYRGSWMNLSPVIGLHRRSKHIHLVSHKTGMHPVLRLLPEISSGPADLTVSANPSALTWQASGEPVITAIFESTSRLRIRGARANLAIEDAAEELTPFTGCYFFEDPQDGSYIFTSYETGRRYKILIIRGRALSIGSEALGASERRLVITGDDGWEVAIQEIATAAELTVDSSFEAVHQRVRKEFEAYLEAIAGWRTADTPAAALAAYVLWSATVEPAGFLQRESVLMSKHWMDKVWSWDHAFNALALAPGAPDLAIDQYLAPFDHQDSAGAMPDSITHSEVLYNFVKPPIHGWALRRLRDRLSRPLSTDELDLIYGRLSRWSQFWLNHRTAPGCSLPHYQHGNDSGWDNSTTFDHDRVVVAPDLAAFLAVQLDVLAHLATELDKGDLETTRWARERDRVEQALLSDLRDDHGFFAVGARNGRISKRSSLLNLLPILAGRRLPAELIDTLAAGIRDHLTAWGPATQRPDTEEYESDGYWRGPIWAPSTMLIEEGLRAAGVTDLADTINQRFRALCEASGFAENFDALTGEGLRDRAYTWTASVYLVFAHDHVDRTLSTAQATGHPIQGSQ